MAETQKLRLVKWKKIEQGGMLRFVFLRGALGWGLPMGIIGMIFENALRKDEALAWYFILELCLVGGILWGLATWFISVRLYSKSSDASLSQPGVD